MKQIELENIFIIFFKNDLTFLYKENMGTFKGYKNLKKTNEKKNPNYKKIIFI